MTENLGEKHQSVPDLGGINPGDAAADILATIQDAAAEQISQDAAKMVIVTIQSKASEQVDVVREYADEPDGLNYPAINASVKPAPGDQALAIERPGGMVIIGKAWAPGDPDLNTVRSGADMEDNSIGNRALAGDAVASENIKTGAVGSEKIAENAVRNSELAGEAVDTGNVKNGAITDAKLASNYSPSGHGHGSHNHSGGGSAGGHKHTYSCWSATSTWEASRSTNYSTSTDGSHGHGDTGNAQVN